MPHLIFTSPGFSTHDCTLAEGKTTVGRDPRNNIVINEPSVSADHCDILVNGHEVIVREHGSVNGTWINNRRIEGQSELKHGQTVRFGNVSARLKLETEAEDTSTTDMTAVHLHMRAMIEQNRPKEVPPEHQVVDAGTDANAAQTVVMPASAKPEPIPTPPPPPAAPSGPPSRVWLFVLIVAFLLVAVWWWLQRDR
jgi:adenylate cyclase